MYKESVAGIITQAHYAKKIAAYQEGFGLRKYNEGDHVKIKFSSFSHPPAGINRGVNAVVGQELMWVKITRVGEHGSLTGILDSTPIDLIYMKRGDSVNIHRTQVCDCLPVSEL